MTPDAVLGDVVTNIGDAQGYSDARGIHPARLAVAQYYDRRGVPGVGPDDVFLGNGVSELIVMALQALLNPGDEVLVPSPDYPLWTGAVNLCGGRAVHYRCDEQAGWDPDLEHVASLITRGHPGARHHQPEQPDRRGLLARDAARAARPRPPAQPAGADRRDLRPDPLRRRGARHRPPRSRPDLPVLTLRRDVQDLPAGRLPVGLAGGLRAAPGGAPSTWRAWSCSPTCGCARTCPRSTPSRPRWTAASTSRRCCSPAAGCAISGTAPGRC